MKILIVANVEFPLNLRTGIYQGGTESVAAESYKILNQLGIETHILVPQDSDTGNYENVCKYSSDSAQVMRTSGVKRIYFRFDLNSIENYINEKGITHLYTHTQNSYVLNFMLSLGLPTLHLQSQACTHHFANLRHFSNFEKFKRWPNTPSRIMSISKYVEDDINKSWPNTSSGVLQHFIWDSPSPPENKLKYKYDLCFIARIEPEYMQIDLAKLAISSGNTIAFIGKSNHAAYHHNLQVLAKENPGKIHLLGQLDRCNITKVFQDTHYYLAFMENEGFGLATYEASLSGLHCLLLSRPDKPSGVIDYMNSNISTYIYYDKLDKLIDNFKNLKYYNKLDIYNHWLGKNSKITYGQKVISILKEIK